MTKNISISVYAQSVWGNHVVRREFSPVRERPARDGCPGDATCPGVRQYGVFTSVMTQWYEWGHQSDLKQPSKVQGIFNLPVVACFVDNAFPWLQRVGRFYSFYNNLSRSGQKRGHFWMKIQILD